jgi:hypothetical protein
MDTTMELDTGHEHEEKEECGPETQPEAKHKDLPENALEIKPQGKLVSTLSTYGRRPSQANAIAHISVDGLSVRCLSELRDAYEIGFLRKHHSDVQIHVYGPGCDLLWNPTWTVERKVRIEVRRNPSSGLRPPYCDQMSFDEDFGFMPNLESPEWHNGPVTIRPGAENFLSAKLVLQDVMLYTRKRSLQLALQKDPATDVTIRPFVGVGNVLGACILANEATNNEDIEIVVFARNDQHKEEIITGQRFPKAKGPYQISIATKAADSGKGHLHMLYQHIVQIPNGSKEFELQYIGPEPIWRPCSSPYRGPGMESTEFACQNFGGGNGPLPPFPPPEP